MGSNLIFLLKIELLKKFFYKNTLFFITETSKLLFFTIKEKVLQKQGVEHIEI